MEKFLWNKTVVLMQAWNNTGKKTTTTTTTTSTLRPCGSAFSYLDLTHGEISILAIINTCKSCLSFPFPLPSVSLLSFQWLFFENYLINLSAFLCVEKLNEIHWKLIPAWFLLFSKNVYSLYKLQETMHCVPFPPVRFPWNSSVHKKAFWLKLEFMAVWQHRFQKNEN